MYGIYVQMRGVQVSAGALLQLCGDHRLPQNGGGAAGRRADVGGDQPRGHHVRGRRDDGRMWVVVVLLVLR